MKTEWTNRRIATATITILIVLVLAGAVYQVRETLILVFVGIIFALAVRGPVDALHKYLRLPRPVAITLVLVVALMLIPILLVSLIPALVDSVRAVLPVAAEGYADLAARLPWPIPPQFNVDTILTQASEYLSQNSSTLLSSALGFSSTVLALLFNTVTILLIGTLWMLEQSSINRFLVALAPAEQQPTVRRILYRIEHQVGAFLVGLLLVGIVTGIIIGIGYFILGLRLALALAILGGMLMMIPIPGIGAILTATFVGLASFADSPSRALVAVVFTIVVFQVMNMIVFPKIMGSAVGISTLGVMLSLMVFVALFGGIGALLAVPLAAIIQILVDELIIQPHEDREADLRNHVADAALAMLETDTPPARPSSTATKPSEGD